MLLVVEKPYFKAIVIKVGLFCSEIVDERHFDTLEDAQDFKEMITTCYGNDMICVICKV